MHANYDIITERKGTVKKKKRCTLLPSTKTTRDKNKHYITQTSKKSKEID